MKNAMIAIVYALTGIMSSSSFAAVVTVLPNTGSFQTPTTNVTFDALPNGTTFSYTEAGMTVSNTSQLQRSGLGAGAYPGDYSLNTYESMVYSFASPVTAVGWDEYFGSNTTAHLYKDAAGTQLIGDYPIGISSTLTTLRFHGFASDTAFQRMVLTGSALTATINNLRYTPEPTMLLASCGAALLFASRDLLGRRRKLPADK